MLVIIASDPHQSHRPAEGVRVAAGLASYGTLPVKVCFCQVAGVILSRDPSGFVDGDVIKRYLPALAKHATAILAESGDPILEGEPRVPFQRIGLTELAELAKTESKVIRF